MEALKGKNNWNKGAGYISYPKLYDMIGAKKVFKGKTESVEDYSQLFSERDKKRKNKN